MDLEAHSEAAWLRELTSAGRVRRGVAGMKSQASLAIVAATVKREWLGGARAARDSAPVSPGRGFLSGGYGSSRHSDGL